MTTNLDPEFLRAVVLITSFKGGDMARCQAALLAFALEDVDFCAAELPRELTGGNTHLAGAATGALIATGMLEVVGRIKSPDHKAKGRKLDLLRRSASKETIRTWFHRHDIAPPPARQTELQLSA